MLPLRDLYFHDAAIAPDITITHVGSDGIAVVFNAEQLRLRAPTLCHSPPAQLQLWDSRDLKCLRYFLEVGTLPVDSPSLEQLIEFADFCECPSLIVHLLSEHRGHESFSTIISFVGKSENPSYRALVANWARGQLASEPMVHIEDGRAIIKDCPGDRTLALLKSLSREGLLEPVFSLDRRIEQTAFDRLVTELGPQSRVLRVHCCGKLTSNDLCKAAAICPLEELKIIPCEEQIDIPDLQPVEPLLTTVLFAEMVARLPTLRRLHIDRRMDPELSVAALAQILASCTQLESVYLRCEGITGQFVNELLLRNPHLETVQIASSPSHLNVNEISVEIVQQHPALQRLVLWAGAADEPQFVQKMLLGAPRPQVVRISRYLSLES